MRRIGRLVITIAAVATLLGALPGAPAQAGTGLYKERHAMFRATNGSRDRFALTGVNIDRAMSKIARHHSLKMAQEQSLFHTASPASVYLKGIRWHYWGENVGVTGGTVGDLESAFMASLPHRQNILNRTFRHVAIGAVRVDGVLWVTVFFYG
ncbi:MAG: CAP domain-containing protein [Actinomycetota bacterium]